jgi:hypothetical protein
VFLEHFPEDFLKMRVSLFVLAELTVPLGMSKWRKIIRELDLAFSFGNIPDKIMPRSLATSVYAFFFHMM